MGRKPSGLLSAFSPGTLVGGSDGTGWRRRCLRHRGLGQAKAPPERGLNDWKRLSLRYGLHGADVRRLQTFGTLDHVESNSLAFR